MTANSIHKDFRLDDRAFSSGQELMSFVEENYPEGSSLIRSWFSDEGLLKVMTSGSTGDPKIIELSREQMIASAKATGEFFGLDPGSRALLCLPLKYIAGKMMLVRAMTLGWKLYGTAPEVHLKFHTERTYDFAAMTPLQLNANLNAIDSIRTLIVGGGPVGDELQMRIRDLSTRVYATYGMTETVTHVALRALNAARGAEIPSISYKALPGVKFTSDERDCLVVQAPHLSIEKLITNDVVNLISDSEFIWRGRYDRVINTGGIKLLPEEIEAKFAKCISNRFFAASIEHDVLGEQMVFVVEGEADQVTMSELREYRANNKERIEKYEVPKRLFFLPRFAETGNSKVDRMGSLNLLNPLI